MVWTGVLLVLTALAPVPGAARWQWPLHPAPRVVRGFDPPSHPWEAGHRGVDLAARPGQPVYAAGPGRVGYAGVLAGRGVVTVVHGALRTTYLPVEPAVRTGQAVAAGARIGRLEAVAGHCGQSGCLHWGLLRGASYLDPLTLLGLGPVRLLPWWGRPGPRPDATVVPPAGTGRDLPDPPDLPGPPPAVPPPAGSPGSPDPLASPDPLGWPDPAGSPDPPPAGPPRAGSPGGAAGTGDTARAPVPRPVVAAAGGTVAGLSVLAGLLLRGTPHRPRRHRVRGSPRRGGFAGGRA